MPGVDAFEKNVRLYEEWFDDHPFAYLSELHAVQKLLPTNGSGIEIGMGTGRFAAPLGIKQGIEPSRSMAEIGRKKGSTTSPALPRICRTKITIRLLSQGHHGLFSR